ncbi:hypothetical protein ACIQLJ_01575 [Microbacterium sp. NPDC091313]
MCREQPQPHPGRDDDGTGDEQLTTLIGSGRRERGPVRAGGAGGRSADSTRRDTRNRVRVRVLRRAGLTRIRRADTALLGRGHVGLEVQHSSCLDLPGGPSVLRNERLPRCERAGVAVGEAVRSTGRRCRDDDGEAIAGSDLEPFVQRHLDPCRGVRYIGLRHRDALDDVSVHSVSRQPAQFDLERTRWRGPIPLECCEPHSGELAGGVDREGLRTLTLTDDVPVRQEQVIARADRPSFRQIDDRADGDRDVVLGIAGDRLDGAVRREAERLSVVRGDGLIALLRRGLLRVRPHVRLVEVHPSRRRLDRKHVRRLASAGGRGDVRPRNQRARDRPLAEIAAGAATAAAAAITIPTIPATNVHVAVADSSALRRFVVEHPSGNATVASTRTSIVFAYDRNVSTASSS